MREYIKNLLFRVIPPSRRFVDRKFQENIEETKEIIKYKVDILEKKYNELCTILIEQEQLINSFYIKQTEELEKYYTRLNNLINQEIKILCEEQRNQFKEVAIKYENTCDYLKEQNQYIYGCQEETIKKGEMLSKEQNIVLEKSIESSKNEIKKQLVQHQKITEENLWAHIFNDTIRDSNWLTNKAFAPGRWAAGYQMLYVIYRILGVMKPKKILELGLGRTTRLISQYSKYFNKKHQVVESDQSWIDFFVKEYKIPESVEIVKLETETKQYLDDAQVIMFKNFEERFQNEKYDFICIDAPLGGKAIKYARVDVLKVLPQCLQEDFVIILDDTERIGEKNTISLIQKKLEESKINYLTKRYDGRKSTTIIVSPRYRFLTSL